MLTSLSSVPGTQGGWDDHAPSASLGWMGVVCALALRVGRAPTLAFVSQLSPWFYLLWRFSERPGLAFVYRNISIRAEVCDHQSWWDTPGGKLQARKGISWSWRIHSLSFLCLNDAGEQKHQSGAMVRAYDETCGQTLLSVLLQKTTQPLCLLWLVSSISVSE